MEIAVKTCSKCHQEKSLDDFDNRSSAKDGKRGQCKACMRAKSRIKYQNNPEPRLTKQRAWRQQNPEQSSAISRRYYEHHKDEKLGRGKEWNEQNREAYRAHITLNNAVALGKVKRPTVCERCGVQGKLDGHHHDYSKPLDVLWLCRSCHVRITLEENRCA